MRPHPGVWVGVKARPPGNFVALNRALNAGSVPKELDWKWDVFFGFFPCAKGRH